MDVCVYVEVVKGFRSFVKTTDLSYRTYLYSKPLESTEIYVIDLVPKVKERNFIGQNAEKSC